jgi:hypothetical protein
MTILIGYMGVSAPINMFGSNQDLLSYVSNEHNNFHGKCQNNNPDSIGIYPIALTRAAAASPTVRYIGQGDRKDK